MPSNRDGLYSTKQAAAYLGCCAETLKRWARRHRAGEKGIGGWWFTRAELDALKRPSLGITRGAA